MLNPSKDRLDYGNILHHDDNYKLDFAIGATYSLELDSLILSAISLDSYGEFDKNLINKPILLLNALRKTSNKIALFCESGQILFNDNRRKVYVLLEDIVFPVLTSKEFENNHYASYHPKFWLIRYTKEDNIRYRIIVLSRNLTSNRSWDISFVMDGNISDNQTNKNDALIEFIKYSIDNSFNNKKSINHEKIEKMYEILDELKYVDFNLDSDIFSDFEFIVNGVDDRSYQIQNQPLFQKNWDRILIMTPFLSKDVISKFNKKINVNSNSILISQSDSFKKLTKEDCDNFNLYCLRDEIVNGEREISEEDTDFYNQDIHAKIYVCEKNNCCELYLGSLNASCNALRGNIELMVKLKSKNLTVEQISQNIFNNGGDNPFEEYWYNHVTPALAGTKIPGGEVTLPAIGLIAGLAGAATAAAPAVSSAAASLSDAAATTRGGQIVSEYLPKVLQWGDPGRYFGYGNYPTIFGLQNATKAGALFDAGLASATVTEALNNLNRGEGNAEDIM